MKKGLFHSIRNAFISGLLVLAPLAVTWLVFSYLFERVGGGFRRYFFFFVPDKLLEYAALGLVWNVLATVIVLAMITALGYLSRYFLSQYFGGLAERFIQSIPGVNTVYNTVKQIVDTFSSQHRNLFSKVVLVEFPRPGVYTVGFLTNRPKGELQARIPGERWAVFVPTTPNPTSGFLLLLPRDQITELEMSVGEGMKLIISGGTVIPPWPAGGSRAPVAAESPPPVSGQGNR